MLPASSVVLRPERHQRIGQRNQCNSGSSHTRAAVSSGTILSEAIGPRACRQTYPTRRDSTVPAYQYMVGPFHRSWQARPPELDALGPEIVNNGRLNHSQRRYITGNGLFPNAMANVLTRGLANPTVSPLAPRR